MRMEIRFSPLTPRLQWLASRQRALSVTRSRMITTTIITTVSLSIMGVVDTIAAVVAAIAAVVAIAVVITPEVMLRWSGNQETIRTLHCGR